MVKPKCRHKNKRATKRGHLPFNPTAVSSSDATTPKNLISQAVEKVNEFEPRAALKLYKLALSLLEPLPSSSENRSLLIDALQSSAYILLEQGRIAEARQNLTRAVTLSPDSGHEKYMYLAQLADSKEAIELYQRGIDLIRKSVETDVLESSAAEMRRTLSNAFCAMAELHMTDLCDEPDAEVNCQTAIESATEADPHNPQAWLTSANFFTVKSNTEAAKEAIERCISLYWPQVEAIVADIRLREDRQLKAEDLEEEDDALNEEASHRLDLEEISGIPFEAHIQMARMLMELDLYERAADVLEALLEEDDEYPELFYLLVVVGQKIWTESDPERLRHYAKMAKQMCNKMGDLELANEMDAILKGLPREEKDASTCDEESDELDVSSTSEDEDENMDITC